MGKARKKDPVLDDDCQLESWSDKDSKIDVAEAHVGGSLGYNLAVHAKVDATPDRVYEILTDPSCENIFRGIKSCTHRAVLEEHGPKRKLEVTHRAISRFLFLTVHFDTSLFVWEDSQDKTIRFQMAHTGFMRMFDGMWTIRPFDQRSVSQLAAVRSGVKAVSGAEGAEGLQLRHGSSGSSGGGSHHGSWFNPSSLFHSFMHHADPQASSSLVTLEQCLVPKHSAPPGLRNLVRGMCVKQIRDMMEDLRAEAERRRARDDVKEGGKAITSSPVAGRHVSRCHAHPPAASITSGMQPLLWGLITPITITVQL